MKIEYITGDLLQTDVKHIIHGCNSKGVMGSGVAKVLREKYPRAYQDYNDVYNNYGLELGDVIVSVQDDGKQGPMMSTIEWLGTLIPGFVLPYT